MIFNTQFIEHFNKKLERHAESRMDKTVFDSFENYKISENYFLTIVDKFIKVFDKMQNDDEVSNLCGEVIENFLEEYISKCNYGRVYKK
jgi:hypothetical protein